MKWRHLVVVAAMAHTPVDRQEIKLVSVLQEMLQMRIKQTGNVDVVVDSAESVDLGLVLREMRETYEALVVKNKQEVEKWFQAKVRRENIVHEHLKTMMMKRWQCHAILCACLRWNFSSRQS